MISAKVIAHSKHALTGQEIVTVVATLPRIILSELNTHRAISKNSASSRAIPFEKMVKMVQENPFIPIAWQKDHKGMQGNEYFDGKYAYHIFPHNWLLARNHAVDAATELHKLNITKQLCNRLLEPFMWHTVILTATEWENFFHLRCPQYVISGKTYRSRNEAIWEEKDKSVILATYSDLDWLSINKGQAEIHMMALAEAIYDAIHGSIPKELQPGEWHLPFGDTIDIERVDKETINPLNFQVADLIMNPIKIATARCARVSYLNFEGKDNYLDDIDLHNSLLIRPYTNKKGVYYSSDDPIHASPSEHCAQAMSEKQIDDNVIIESGQVFPGRCRNFKDFIPYRVMVEK